jgi:hypothetical protein
MADGQRWAVARANDEILVSPEHDGQRKGAFQPLQRLVRGLDRLQAPGQFAPHQMCDDLGIGLR